jgi:hypothetical protein
MEIGLNNSALPDNSMFCCYCGVRFDNMNRKKHMTKDHLIPLSRGGANNCYNKRNCCAHCNTQKGGSLPHHYLLYLEQDYSNAKTTSERYELEIKIENVKYIIQYVNTAGEKIFANEASYKWFKRRFLNTQKCD